MMWGAIGCFLAARRKPKLPYDAEVEYLESTGTQWIDTGVGGGYETDFELCVMMPSPTGRQIGGVRSSSSNFRYVQVQSNPLGNIYYGYNNTWSLDSYKTLSGWMTLRATGNQCYVDNVLFHTFTAAQFASAGTIWLHATHGASAQGTAALRISTARIWSGGAIVRDMIPVRFTNEQGQCEGAMYDRANPTVGMDPDGSARTDGLYRNRGTGAFVIGPDKTA